MCERKFTTERIEGGRTEFFSLSESPRYCLTYLDRVEFRLSCPSSVIKVVFAL